MYVVYTHLSINKLHLLNTLGNAPALPRPPFQMGDIDIIHYIIRTYIICP